MISCDSEEGSERLSKTRSAADDSVGSGSQDADGWLRGSDDEFEGDERGAQK
jgi:hypothetical protein